MPNDNLTTLPDTTTVIDQTYLIAPLGGPKHPQTYLDAFPEEVYAKTLDSHLVKLLYAMIGPSGVGWLHKEYLQARLMFEELGLETFDLTAFYGDPLRFGRVVEEVYDDDPTGLLPHDAWQRIKARDARYRNRAIDFVHGAHMGNTASGMALVARSGLGHDVEVIANYRALYDEHADDRLFLPYYGKTRSTEEMIVLPRRELSRSETQLVRIDGDAEGGTFRLFFPVGSETLNTTGPIPATTDRYTLQQYLEALPTIGRGNVRLKGGPLPGSPIEITFTGDLAARDVPELIPTSELVGAGIVLAVVETVTGGVDAADEVVNIAPRDLHYLQEAIDRIRPQTMIPTVGEAPGLQQTQIWNSLSSTSSYTQVLRYVTGQSAIRWPSLDARHWIEAAVEHEGRKHYDGGSQHYCGFHNVAAVTASSTHLGPFVPYQVGLYPVLAQSASDQTYDAIYALAIYAEPLTMTSADGTQQVIGGIYPLDYQSLPGVPAIRSDPRLFWASSESTASAETLVLDLGRAQAVNYLTFEITRKPVDVRVEYDLLDQAPAQEWVPAQLDPQLPSIVTADFEPESTNPWQPITINCVNGKGELIFTRFLRITFTRRPGAPFVAADGSTTLPWSIEARNLRVGRNTV